MADIPFKQYDSFKGFVTDVLFNVMEDKMVSIIINYNDYQGLLSSLFEKTINGKSFYLNTECADLMDDDIKTAQMNDDNILVSIFDTGEIIGEAVVFQKAESFAPATYYIEKDARSAFAYPISGLVIPFQIAKGKL